MFLSDIFSLHQWREAIICRLFWFALGGVGLALVLLIAMATFGFVLRCHIAFFLAAGGFARGLGRLGPIIPGLQARQRALFEIQVGIPCEIGNGVLVPRSSW